MGIQVGGGIFVKYGTSLLKANTKYARFGHAISGFLCILTSFVEILLVTKESKALYLCSVALPSALLTGTYVFAKFKKLKSTASINKWLKAHMQIIFLFLRYYMTSPSKYLILINSVVTKKKLISNQATVPVSLFLDCIKLYSFRLTWQ